MPSLVLVYALILSLLVCVPLTVAEIRRGTALGKGRGGRTLGWFLLPTIFLSGAYAVYSSLGSGSESILAAPSVFSGLDSSAASSQLVTQTLSVSSLLWAAWVPILVYSGLARDSARSKAGWVLRRMAAALALFLILIVLAAATWSAFGTPGSGASAPEWVSATSNVLFLIGISSLVAFLSLFSGFFSGALMSLPILVASFAVPALVGGTLRPMVTQLSETPPTQVAPSLSRLKVIVRLYGPKGHKDVEMIVDTGATYTSISPSLARDLGISGRFGRTVKIKIADGSLRKSSLANAVVQYGRWKARVTVCILPSAPGAELLLGFTTLKALGLKIDPAAQRLESSS
jgi:predicted aspartyl protease